MTPTYQARAGFAGVPFKASPQMDFGRTTIRPAPTHHPMAFPRVKARHETSRSRSGSVLNARIEGPLSRLYPGRVNEIIEQARASYFYHTRGRVESNPELYELFENSNIDEAIESLGLRRWTIGRPKID